MRSVISLIVAAYMLLCLSNAWGAPTFDAETTDSSSFLSTLSMSHTIGGGCTNPYLIVAVHSLAQVLTHNSVVATAGALTQIGSTLDYTDNGGSDHWTLSLWGRAGPTGAQTIDITLDSGATELWGFARSYCGVHQSVPLGTPVGELDSSIDVSSASGELVVDAMILRSSAGPPAATVGQTERYNQALTYDSAAGSDKAGASTTTMSWTTADALIGVALKPATGARRPSAPVIFR